jgi:hypothetical protein
LKRRGNFELQAAAPVRGMIKSYLRGKISPPFQRRSTPDHKLKIDIRNYIQGGGGWLLKPPRPLNWISICKQIGTRGHPSFEKEGKLKVL